MKEILVIQGHPDKKSLCHSLAESYVIGAKKAEAIADFVHISDLKFDPLLHHSYKENTELEPDLKKMQQKILKAEHLVFTFPVWWGTMPAILKGFIDRVFLPGFAFKYRAGSSLWDKLLKGRSARMIITMDSPGWYYHWIVGKPAIGAMKNATLEFCGINPVKVTEFNQVRHAKPEKILKWISLTEKLGGQLK